MNQEQEVFTCPKCQRTSYNWMDVLEKYCGACHEWFSTTEEHDQAFVDWVTWAVRTIQIRTFSQPLPLSRPGRVVSRKFHARRSKR